MNQTHSKLTRLLALTVFSIFALCILLVLLTGATVYRDLTERSGESHNRRTTVNYLTTRVHQAETVTVSGSEILLLEETVAGKTYLTQIYCQDGWLRELYTAAGVNLPLEDGEPILECDSFTCTLKDGLLTLTAGADQIYLHLPHYMETAYEE